MSLPKSDSWGKGEGELNPGLHSSGLGIFSPRAFAPRGSRLDSGRAAQFTMNPGDALDLAFGREPLVKSFVPEFARLFRPRRQPSAPAFDSSVLGFRILRGQIGANANHRLERDRFGDHVVVVAPSVAPHLRARFQEIPHFAVV